MRGIVSKAFQGVPDARSIAGLVDSSQHPDTAISLTFSDGVVHVTRDRSGDWTITAGLSLASDRLGSLTKRLGELGFFEGTEQSGMVYHLWTTALEEAVGGRHVAEEKLLGVLKTFQTSSFPSYIG